jgi:hypothetical protein
LIRRGSGVSAKAFNSHLAASTIATPRRSIKINACANLVNPDYTERFVAAYVDFLAIIAAESACFSLGSDAHKISDLARVTTAWQVAAQLGLPVDRIWKPSENPLVHY